MKKYVLFFAVLFSLFTTKANAKLFDVTATRISTGDTVSATFDSAQEAMDYFKGNSLNQAFGTNVDGEAVTIDLNFRGLGASLAYGTGDALTLNIDGIVSNKVFDGNTRDDSVQLLKDYLKTAGSDIVNQIFRRLAAVSPSDPIAGNPTSLMSQMVEDDFELAFIDAIHDEDDLYEDGKRVGNEMGAGVKYSSYDVSGIESSIISVSPFSWRRNIGDSNAKLLLKFPVLKMITTQGAKTYQASSSVGFKIPLIKNFWSITPMASIGAVGSEDMASGAAMRGVSATNKLRLMSKGGWGIQLGTLYGNYRTEKVQVNSYKSNPDIQNMILKNGLVLSLPTTVTGNYVVDLSATNTRFYGADLYIENAMDYGIGFVKTNRTTNNEVRLDLKYYTYDAETIATIGNGKRGVSGYLANLKFQY